MSIQFFSKVTGMVFLQNYSGPMAKNLSSHFREKLNRQSCLEKEVVYGKDVSDLLNSLNSRRYRCDFWSFFSFFTYYRLVTGRTPKFLGMVTTFSILRIELTLARAFWCPWNFASTTVEIISLMDHLLPFSNQNL